MILGAMEEMASGEGLIGAELEETGAPELPAATLELCTAGLDAPTELDPATGLEATGLEAAGLDATGLDAPAELDDAAGLDPARELEATAPEEEDERAEVADALANKDDATSRLVTFFN